MHQARLIATMPTQSPQAAMLYRPGKWLWHASRWARRGSLGFPKGGVWWNRRGYGGDPAPPYI